MALRLDLCPSGESKGQLVSEARNKRGQPIPVVGGRVSQPLIQSKVEQCTNERARPSFQREGRPSSCALTPYPHFYGWQKVCSSGKICLSLSARVNASTREGLENPPFFLVASQHSRFVVMVTTPRYFFHHIGCAPFWRGGQCVVQGGIRDPPFFGSS